MRCETHKTKSFNAEMNPSKEQITFVTLEHEIICFDISSLSEHHICMKPQNAAYYIMMYKNSPKCLDKWYTIHLWFSPFTCSKSVDIKH